MTRRSTNAELKMRGTVRQDRPHAEPVPTPEPLPPAFLSEGGLRIWRKYAGTLASQGLLSSTDVEAFGTWCFMQAIAEESMAAGKVPAREVLLAARAGANEFGLTPYSKLRLRGKLEDPPAKPGKTSDFSDLDD